MAKAKLPVSRARTAYGLLSEIAALALAEPKRMRMSVTLLRDDPASAPNFYPACGTVGCIAGWTTVLKGLRTDPFGGVLSSAARTLGLIGEQEDDLFCDVPLCSATNQQTVAHAKAVARHIREFQKKYRHQLLAKKV